MEIPRPADSNRTACETSGPPRSGRGFPTNAQAVRMPGVLPGNSCVGNPPGCVRQRSPRPVAIGRRAAISKSAPSQRAGADCCIRNRLIPGGIGESIGGVRAPLPDDDLSRLAALHDAQVLDTAPEQDFDDIALLASEICGTPMGVVSLIDAERQWFKAKIGLDTEETHRDLAFCAHAVHG